MRFFILLCVTIVNLIFTGAIFPNINISGIAPDIIICTMASMAVMEKSLVGAGIGLVCGLALDCFFSGAIGFFAIPYLVTGVIIYFVCTKIKYLDGYILPFLIAIGAYMIKECVSALIVYMLDISYSFSYMFIRYMVPEALLTGVFILLIHFIFTKIYHSSTMQQNNYEDFKKLK